MSEQSGSSGTAGMAVAYGVGFVPDPNPWPQTIPWPCAPPIPYVPTLPPGLAEAAEAVRLALKEQQEAERAHAEASIAVEMARAKHKAAVDELVRVASGG